MTNTHKKVLGFVGLGLVAALTTFAANVEVPGASALDSVSDNIQVRILAGEPAVAITAISGSVVTDPNYSITVDYENLYSLKATLVNRNADGEIIWEGTIFDDPTTLAPAERVIDLNLEDYNGKGNYTFTITGTGDGGVPVEQTITFVYTSTGPSVEPEDDKPVINPEVPKSVTKTLEVNIYDDLTGGLVQHYIIEDPTDPQNIDLSTLGDGLYKIDLSGKDKNGNPTISSSEVILNGPGADAPVKFEAQAEPFERVVVTVKNAAGETVLTQPFDVSSPGIYTIDMSGLPSGVYTITTDYYDGGGQSVGSTTKTIRKIADGQVKVDVPPIDSVTEVIAYLYGPNGNLVRIIKADRATGLVSVYDADGNLLFTVENGYSDQGFTIPMEGLEYGDYTGTIMYRNAAGELVGDTMPFQIIYNPETPVVPDTGNFFQGLNLTREDYLISGLAIFAAVSVLAFWLVKRNKSNRK